MNNYSNHALVDPLALGPPAERGDGWPAAHEEGPTQSQIAARLRVAHGTVCRLLQNAAEPGIVRGRVIPPERSFVDPEELLERKFGLAEVVIARAASGLAGACGVADSRPSRVIRSSRAQEPKPRPARRSMSRRDRGTG